MSKAKRAVLYALAALLLLIEGAVPHRVCAEDVKKIETPVEIFIYGDKNNVEFKVTGEDGKPIAGASIYIKNGKGEWDFFGITDSKGVKRLCVPLSTQTFQVRKAGYDTYQGTFKVNSLLSRVSVKVKLKKTKNTDPSKPSKPNKPSKPSKPSNPSKPSGGGTKKPGGSKPSSGGGTKKPGTTGSSGGWNTGGSSGSSGKGSWGTGGGSGSSGSGGSDTGNTGSTGNGAGKGSSGKSDSVSKGNGSGLKNPASNGETGETFGSGYPYEENSEETGDSGIDIEINVYKSDGSPLPDEWLELYAPAWGGRLDGNGYMLFPGVAMGAHELYVRGLFGRILAERAFTLQRSNITALENADTVSVGMAAKEITLNVELTDDGQLVLKSVWEGINDRSGMTLPEEGRNRAEPVEGNLILRWGKDWRIWFSVLFLFLLLIGGYLTGRRRERKRIEKEREREREQEYGQDVWDNLE